MAQMTTVARRTVGALVTDAADAKLPSYVTRDQARATINASATAHDRLVLECFWQLGSLLYTKLTSPERRSYVDRVEWWVWRT